MEQSTESSDEENESSDMQFKVEHAAGITVIDRRKINIFDSHGNEQ